MQLPSGLIGHGWLCDRHRTAEFVHRDHLERSRTRGFSPAADQIFGIMSTATVMELRPTRTAWANEFDEFADMDGLVKFDFVELP